jgi:3-deoxy-D-manno-octulosonic-acid transferase
LTRLVYDLFIRLLLLAYRVAALFHPKARKWVSGRNGLLQRIENQFAGNIRPVAWFHCASVGEFEQARPVLEAFRREFPRFKILLTFFSPSGYELRRDYAGADVVSYLPADTPANARRFVGAVNPALVFWVKYEFWYHHLRELRARRVPTLLFSAIFRPNQLFFKPYGGLYREILRCFDRILVQNDESLALLRGLRLNGAELGGDTRFDRVAQIAAAPKAFPLVEAFKGDAQLLVVGSLWPDDWAVLKSWQWAVGSWQTSDCHFANCPLPTANCKLLIAPHEINPARIDRWRAEVEVPSVRYSEATPETARAADMLWIDNVGMLASLYRYADYAFIGGAYGDGLHNTLEAAVYGMPIFFGDKNYRKFQEAHDLLALGCAFAVADGKELARIFSDLRADEPRRRALADRVAAYVQSHRGATERVMGWARGKIND